MIGYSIERIAYAAGFFDGEGCVCIGKNGSIQLRIINTNLPTLEMFQHLFGGSIGNRAQKVNKKQYSWSIYGAEAVNFANLILEFSIEKRDQIIALNEYWVKRSEIKTHSIPGSKGNHANPLRALLINEYVTKLTKMKKGINE